MPLSIFCNTIPDPERRRTIQNAVLDGIGQRPEGEEWEASIIGSQAEEAGQSKSKDPAASRWNENSSDLGSSNQTLSARRSKALHGRLKLDRSASGGVPFASHFRFQRLVIVGRCRPTETEPNVQILLMFVKIW